MKAKSQKTQKLRVLMKPRGRALTALEKQKWLYDGYSLAPFSEALDWIVCSCPCSPAEELRFLLGWSLALRALQILGEGCLGFQPHRCLTFLLSTEEHAQWALRVKRETCFCYRNCLFLVVFLSRYFYAIKIILTDINPPPFTCVCPANTWNVSYTFFFLSFFFFLVKCHYF